MTVCLSMIVKNEFNVIVRCLQTVRPLIDHWVIVDTGSTDGTQDLIREVLRDIPGELHEIAWKDFATNRNEALALARPCATYVLFIDADDTLECDGDLRLGELAADFYELQIVADDVVYSRTQLVRSCLPWAWRGVLHEFLACDQATTGATLAGLRIRRRHDGARRRAGDTYRRDIAILEEVLTTERDPFMRARYIFYLAQSHRDAGDRERALETYLRRADLGFWEDEVFISLLYAARFMEALDDPVEQTLQTYARATAACPRRAEARHGASRLCARNTRHREGYEIAKAGLDLSAPPGALFLEPWIYDYGLRDEYAVNAYWAGAWSDCLGACLSLLGGNALPVSERSRVRANAQAALEHLPRQPNLGVFGRESLIDQHALQPQRELRSRISVFPSVMLAIFAKQKAAALPLYLSCIEALDYPKEAIFVSIRSNNNTDATEQILRDWIARIGRLYAGIAFDATDVADPVQDFAEHEWNAMRFRVLGRLRDISLRHALERGSDFYFVVDVDNFVRPCTLRELVALNLPVVAPLLRSIKPGAFYSNYHAELDANGYYEECDQYHWVLNRQVRGIVEMPLVHATYLVRSDVLPCVTYEDGSDRHEYVVFSDSARRAGVLQYIDNRQVYGYITFGVGGVHHVDDGIARAASFLQSDLQARSRGDGSRSSPARGNRTLLFCTSYATTRQQWDGRYRRWLRAVGASRLNYDCILIVDDGSPVLPEWPDAEIRMEHGPESLDTRLPPILLHHFHEHLGRHAVFDFPGWYRSFAFAGRFALRHGFDRVMHIESDAFLIGERTQRHFNEATDGWTALWCPLYQGYPETALQVIVGSAVARFAELQKSHPHDSLIGREYELQLPFDKVEKQFIGSRYGDYLSLVPGNAEYAANVLPDEPESYYWWLSA